MPSAGHSTKLQKQKWRSPFGNGKIIVTIIGLTGFQKVLLLFGFLIILSNHIKFIYIFILFIFIYKYNIFIVSFSLQSFKWYLLMHLVRPEFLENFTWWQVYRLLKTDMSHKAWAQGHSLPGIHKGFCKWKIKLLIFVIWIILIL